MGVLSWAWRVTRDTGETEPVAVELERNPAAAAPAEGEAGEQPAELPLYFFRPGLRAGPGGDTARIPVFRHVNGSPHSTLKEAYSCEAIGMRLEAADVFALRARVQQLLETIAPARALPLCYFRAPSLGYSLAIYEQGGALTCPVLPGPKIKAHDLAAIRESIVRHLRTAGYLHPGQDPEVGVVRPSDLRLVPPAAAIRSLEDPSIWLPAVEDTSPAGPAIGLLPHAARPWRGEGRQRAAAEPPPPAPDLIALLRHLGAELTRLGRASSPWALYAAEVRPEIWAQTERLTGATDRALVCHLEGTGSSRLELPLRRAAAGETVAALQEQAISVFAAGDGDALAAAVGRYLAAAGFLRRPDEVRVERVGAERGAKAARFAAVEAK